MNSEDSVVAAALKLMIQKGGTLRLRHEEMKGVADLVLVIEPNPNNPDVLHFRNITKAEAEERAEAFKRQLAAMIAADDQAHGLGVEPPKDSDGQ